MISRRELLALLGLAALPGAARAAGRRYVVVGAGVAGLAAASALRRARAEVVVLEARGRLGGRIWTDRSLGVPFDLGASWIHGVDGNPVSELCAAHGVDYRIRRGPRSVVFRDGRPLGAAATAALTLGLRARRRAVAAESERLATDTSVGVVLRRSEPLPGLDPRWEEGMLAAMTGADPDALSAWYGEDDESYGRGHATLPDGFEQVVGVLGAGLDVRTGERVSVVIRTGRGVRLETTGGALEADAAVVTLPLGVLQAGDVRFVPELPAAKLNAVQALGPGDAVKVALRFPRVAWPTEARFLSDLSSSDLARPAMFATDPARPTLVAFVGGRGARALEQVRDAEVVARATDALRGMLGGAVPEPVGALVTRWGRDPYSRGVWSHVPLGASSADYDALAAPAWGRLFFAGEATSRAYRGTVHGALLSGWRAAREALG